MVSLVRLVRFANMLVSTAVYKDACDHDFLFAL